MEGSDLYFMKIHSISAFLVPEKYFKKRDLVILGVFYCLVVWELIIILDNVTKKV